MKHFTTFGRRVSRITLSVLAIFIFQLFSNLASRSSWSDDRTELPLLNILFPAHGYDDNDAIDVVLSGELPSPCYTGGQAIVSAPNAEGEILVRYAAWQSRAGQCQTPDLIDEPVPFVMEANLGRLPAGEYSIVYQASGTELRTAQTTKKKLFVSKASTSDVDSFSYAAVSQALVNDLFLPGEPVRFSVGGRLSLSCSELLSPLQMIREDNVFVVLPVQSSRPGSCEPQLRSFSTEMSLGTLPPGEYLIHIRSRNGKSVNRVFTVLGTFQPSAIERR